MKVWLYAKSMNGKYFYIHIFTGKLFDRNKVRVDKSLIKFGNETDFYSKKDSWIRPSTLKQFEYSEIKQSIIKWIFKGSINIGNRNFEVKE